MRIAIVSDVHNNITNLDKVLNYCKTNSIEKIICCGDLASMETLDFFNDNFSGEIYYCFGNMDDDHLRNYEILQNYKNTKVYKNFGEAEFGSPASKKHKVAFTHYPARAEELCQTGKYDFVFYGHTHKPWEESLRLPDYVKTPMKCIMLNPGNVAGEIYPPTFAIWNTATNNFDLIRINDLKIT